MRHEAANPDQIAAGIAARTHGVVSLGQLRGLGLTQSAIKGRVKLGRLHRVHRGVYAVGHRNLTREGRWLAAVVACGPGAVLSHASAGALWELVLYKPGPAHVTVPSLNGRERREGIVIHRSSVLTPDATTCHRAIPVTTRARTLQDLRLGPEPTRSELERAFLRLCRRRGIPKPEVNARIGGHEVDFVWRARHLVVEVDGYRFHRSRQAFERDRRRDARLRLQGFEVLRFTYRQVTAEAASTARTVLVALGS